MGAWGTGLYSGDFAGDLRSSVGAVARLPFEGERLLEMLCETEPGAAWDVADADHSVFWLVVADQFAKRGIECDRAREMALGVIDEGRDLVGMAGLGMGERDLRKRGAMLAALRARLVAPVVAGKPRAVLRAPQPFLFAAGDVVLFPTTGGQCINALFPTQKTLLGHEWRPDGWGVMVIVECGRAFGFLAFYRGLRAPAAVRDRPDLATIRGWRDWVLPRPGTLTVRHVRKMEMERVATVAIDFEKLRGLCPSIPSGVSDAVGDISLANRLSLPVEGEVVPDYMRGRGLPKVGSLRDVMSG